MEEKSLLYTHHETQDAGAHSRPFLISHLQSLPMPTTLSNSIYPPSLPRILIYMEGFLQTMVHLSALKGHQSPGPGTHRIALR
jgi:hypothetical protein